VLKGIAKVLHPPQRRQTAKILLLLLLPSSSSSSSSSSSFSSPPPSPPPPSDGLVQICVTLSQWFSYKTAAVHNPTLHIFQLLKICRVGLLLNCLMLSSLPCFYAFCWSAIPTSRYIFILVRTWVSYIHVEVVFYSEGHLLEVSTEMLVCTTVIHTAIGLNLACSVPPDLPGKRVCVWVL